MVMRFSELSTPVCSEQKPTFSCIIAMSELATLRALGTVHLGFLDETSSSHAQVLIFQCLSLLPRDLLACESQTAMRMMQIGEGVTGI